jgi:hypothetical protein
MDFWPMEFARAFAMAFSFPTPTPDSILVMVCAWNFSSRRITSSLRAEILPHKAHTHRLRHRMIVR